MNSKILFPIILIAGIVITILTTTISFDNGFSIVSGYEFGGYSYEEGTSFGTDGYHTYEQEGFSFGQ